MVLTLYRQNFPFFKQILCIRCKNANKLRIMICNCELLCQRDSKLRIIICESLCQSNLQLQNEGQKIAKQNFRFLDPAPYICVEQFIMSTATLVFSGTTIQYPHVLLQHRRSPDRFVRPLVSRTILWHHASPLAQRYPSTRPTIL